MKDFAEILTLRNELRDIFGGFQRNCSRADQLYNLEMQFEMPLKYLKYIPPTAKAKVDAMVAHAIATHPLVTVIPGRLGGEAQTQADALEYGWAAFLQRLDAGRPETVWQQVAKLAPLYGLGVLKGPLWEPLEAVAPTRHKGEHAGDFKRRVEKWEDKKRHFFPIQAYPLAPRLVMWEPGRWPPRYVIETGMLPAAYIQSRYGVALDGSQGNLLNWTEYWDEDMRCFMVGDTPVKQIWRGGQWHKFEHPQENAFGFIPYHFLSFGGGRASEKPDEEFVGMLTPLDASLVGEARWKTALQALAEESAFAGEYIEGMDAAKLQRPYLGQRVTKPDGVKIEIPPRAPVPPELISFLNILRGDVEESGGPAILSGVKSPGEPYGYQSALRIGQGNLKIQAMVASLNRMAGLFLHQVARMVDIMQEELTVWGIQGSERVFQTLKPGRLGDFYPEVDFEATSPEMADRKIYTGIALKQAGLLSDRTIGERFLGLKDWEKEEVLKMVNAIQGSPEAVQVQAITALEEMGMGDMLAKLAERQEGNGKHAVLQRQKVVKEQRRLVGGTAPEGLQSANEGGGT